MGSWRLDPEIDIIAGSVNGTICKDGVLRKVSRTHVHLISPPSKPQAARFHVVRNMSGLFSAFAQYLFHVLSNRVGFTSSLGFTRHPELLVMRAAHKSEITATSNPCVQTTYKHIPKP